MISLIQQARLHGDNIHHNHQLFQPDEDRILVINPYIDIVVTFIFLVAGGRESKWLYQEELHERGKLERSSQSILTQFGNKHIVHNFDRQTQL